MKDIDLSIVIANYNRKDLVKQSIDSIKKHTKGINYEIIVVDDCSTDDSVEFIKKNLPDVKLVINKKNSGPVVANNNGIRQTSGRYILILDNDTIFQNNILKQMVDYMDENHNVGITGCNLVYENGSFQKSCGDIFKLPIKIIWDFFLNILIPHNKITDKNKFTEDFHKKIVDVSYVCGACYMIKRKTMENVGLVDEQYYMYAEEQDWYYRIIKNGWKIKHLPYGPVVHFGGTSGRNNEKKEVSTKFRILAFKNMLLFYKKNYGFFSSMFIRILMFISLSSRYLFSKKPSKDKIEKDLIKVLFSKIKVKTVEPKIKVPS